MKKAAAALMLAVCLLTLTACEKEDSATSNTKMTAAENSEPAPAEVSQPLPAPAAQPVQAESGQLGEYSIPLSNGTFVQAKNAAATVKLNSLYDCDIQSDRQLFSGRADMVVGDNFFATQINDWYMNPSQYVGKTVEIEGFYINEFAPYEFIGRYGPVCQYCQGGYVCYEILTDLDMSGVTPIKDWIRVKGVLRQGEDAESGVFGYIEALELEVCPQPGMATVTN